MVLIENKLRNRNEAFNFESVFAEQHRQRIAMSYVDLTAGYKLLRFTTIMCVSFIKCCDNKNGVMVKIIVVHFI